MHPEGILQRIETQRDVARERRLWRWWLHDWFGWLARLRHDRRCGCAHCASTLFYCRACERALAEYDAIYYPESRTYRCPGCDRVL